MTATTDALQPLLYQALAEPIGLLISTSDPRRLLQRLYSARRAANDQALAVLQFRTSPLADGQLVILKETVELGAEPTGQFETETSASLDSLLD